MTLEQLKEQVDKVYIQVEEMGYDPRQIEPIVNIHIGIPDDVRRTAITIRSSK